MTGQSRLQPRPVVQTLLKSSRGSSGKLEEHQGNTGKGWVVWLLAKPFFSSHAPPVPPFLHRTLSPHSQSWSVLAWWTLLALPWWFPETLSHHKGPQALAGSSWPWCTLRILLSGLWLSTGTKIECVSTWWTALAPTWWLSENLSHTTYVLQRLFQWLSLIGRWQVEVPWPLCWPALHLSATGCWPW